MIRHPLRRRILTLFVNYRELTRTELAALLAADEEVAASDIDQLELSLHHNHLPRLDSEGYIEYDARAGDIILWEDPERIQFELRDS